jgi:hypothetical protein
MRATPVRLHPHFGKCGYEIANLPLRDLVTYSRRSTIQSSVGFLNWIEVCHESAFKRQANLRELQTGEAAGTGVRHLHQSAPQAASRVNLVFV